MVGSVVGRTVGVAALVAVAAGGRVGTEVGTTVGTAVGVAALATVAVGGRVGAMVGTAVGVEAGAHPLNKSVSARIQA